MPEIIFLLRLMKIFQNRIRCIFVPTKYFFTNLRQRVIIHMLLTKKFVGVLMKNRRQFFKNIFNINFNEHQNIYHFVISSFTILQTNSLFYLHRIFFSLSFMDKKCVGFKGFYGSQWLRARRCCRKLSDSIFWLFSFTPR